VSSLAPVVRTADDLMTADREESKYLVSLDCVDDLTGTLDDHIPAHRFTGESANRLPDPQHFVTTIYFDTPTRSQFHAALTNVDRNVKVRGKEYYDLHPSLAELATDPAEILHYQPWLWFELKRREGDRTFKHRFRLPKRDVPHFFAGTAGAAHADEKTKSTLELIDGYCRSLSEPLEASCVVSYRRLSWQFPDGTLRVTLDLDLAFFAPSDDLFTREEPLERGRLGVPALVHDHAVLEVKRRGATPAWLEHALVRAAAKPSRFSKFVAASRAVHGHV
jgi:hypothetical protein